jgi:hypothetical protein
MWKNHEGMVQMVSEVIAVDQEQHPIKADYLDDLRAGTRNGLVVKGRRGLKSQTLGKTAPAWPQPPSPASPPSCSVQLYSFTVFS